MSVWFIIIISLGNEKMLQFMLNKIRGDLIMSVIY